MQLAANKSTQEKSRKFSAQQESFSKCSVNIGLNFSPAFVS